MATTLVDHYYYKDHDVTTIDQIVDLLSKDGIIVDCAQIPENVAWKRRFWNDHGVKWEQIELEQDLNQLHNVMEQGHRVVEWHIAKIENQKGNKGFTLREFERMKLVANHDKTNKETVSNWEKTLVEVYQLQYQYDQLIDQCLTVKQVNDVMTSFVAKANTY